MSFITALGVAVPRYKIEQRVISDFMQKVTDDSEEKRKIAAVFRASGIRSRHSVLSDYGKSEDFDFFPDTENLQPFPGTASRMETYRQEAIALSIAAVEESQKSGAFDFASVTHLITVSCTGMYAPGLDVDLINHFGMPPTVVRSCVNFMGCFAAITAIKMGDAFCRARKDAKVLIVCTELCSLHFQRKCSDDNILANALFGDGSAALVMEATAGKGMALKVEGFHSELLEVGASAMAWHIGNHGFEMKLSSYVPDVLGSEIGTLVERLARKIGVEMASIGNFAIHPGGKKILEVVIEKLGLRPAALDACYQVLRENGNMSSPTILFVLKRLLEDHSPRRNELILGLAFGPGITMESMMLRVVRSGSA